jgi:hypothetical protein
VGCWRCRAVIMTNPNPQLYFYYNQLIQVSAVWRSVVALIGHGFYTGWFTTCGHYCRRWFPRSLWSKKFLQTCVRFWTVTELWAFLIPVHALVWTVSYGTSWRVTYSTRWLIVCVASIISAAWLPHPATNSPVPVSRHSDGIYVMRGRWGGWVGIRLASVYWLTQQLVRVKKPISLTLQWLCRLLMFRTVWR